MTQKNKPTADDDREARLKAALKANMAKRKALIRSKAASEESDRDD